MQPLVLILVLQCATAQLITTPTSLVDKLDLLKKKKDDINILQDPNSRLDDRFNNDRFSNDRFSNDRFNNDRLNNFGRDDDQYNRFDDRYNLNNDRYDDRFATPWERRNNPYSRRRRPMKNFQAQSYVHDDIPFIMMDTDYYYRTNKKDPALKPVFKQTATVTENPNVLAVKYVDENDAYLGLTKNEERVKIFFNNNPNLAPFELRKPGDAYSNEKSYTNKLFNSFKTQRAGDIVGQVFYDYNDNDDYDYQYYQNQQYNQNKS